MKKFKNISGNLTYTVSVFGVNHEKFCKWTGLANNYPSKRKRIKDDIEVNNFFVVPIRSIKEGPNMDLMDIQVEDQKTFVANGLLVHNSSLESLYCGTPVISSKTGGLQEQNIDSQTGEVFGVQIEPASKLLVGSQQIPYIYSDHVSHQQVVDALMQMYSLSRQQRREIGVRARKNVVERYDLNKMVNQWDNALTKHINEFKDGNPQRIRLSKIL